MVNIEIEKDFVQLYMKVREKIIGISFHSIYSIHVKLEELLRVFNYSTFKVKMRGQKSEGEEVTC
jgi:hypothetical protein